MRKRLLLLCIWILVTTLLGAASTRRISFDGFDWRLKASDEPASPGPNYWSDTEDSVWVDDLGLHLKVRMYDGHWWSAEVFTQRRVGYGTYTFTVETPVREYAPSVVAGFFTWDTDPAENNREIDIEFAAWGEEQATFQYVVQPYTDSNRALVFEPNLNGDVTTHRIVWGPESIAFSSYHGMVDPDDQNSESMLIKKWTFPGGPSEGRPRFRINLWLFQGEAPRENTELIVRSFSFLPL